MDSAASLKPKVTVKLNYDKPNGTHPARAYGLSIHSRAPSPAKSYVSSGSRAFSLKDTEQNGQANEGTPVFRPKAKVNSSATTRRVATAGSTVGGIRPSSPTKPRARATVSSSSIATGSSSSRGSSSVTIAGTRTPRPNPPASAPVTPHLHARSIHANASNDNTLPPQPLSPGALHHATSMSSFPAARATSVVGPSSTVSSSAASHRLLASRSVVGLADRERSLTSSPTLKIRSKVTAMSKTNTEPGSTTVGSSSTPSSPIHATMRSTTPNPTVKLRSRRPSSASMVPSSPPAQMFSSSPPAAEPKSPLNGSLRAKAPSTISSAPTSSPPQFYPITTAVSAANPHRFASARPPAAHTPPHSPPLASGSRANSTLSVQPSFQSFSSMPSARMPNSNRPPNGKISTANVDPATVPLPPHSPPASSLSFSSRSSTSHLEPRSGNSTRKYSHSRTNSASTSGSRKSQTINKSGDMRAALDNLMQFTSGTTSEDEGSVLEDGGRGEGGEVGEEYKVKAAAKSDRKMADLEITNRSLLAINASLEATKHRQAKEIQELRRRLRETRLILPPRVFRASKDSTLSTYTDADLGLDAESSSSDDDDDEDETENAKDASQTNGKSAGDATYRRVKLLLDALLKQGTAALEQDKGAVGSRSSVAKVLSPQEVRDYHAGGEHDDDQASVSHDSRSVDDLHSEAEGQTGDEEDIPTDAEMSFDSVDSRDPDASTTSEDEVEALLGSPPILITQQS